MPIFGKIFSAEHQAVDFLDNILVQHFGTVANRPSACAAKNPFWKTFYVVWHRKKEAYDAQNVWCTVNVRFILACHLSLRDRLLGSMVSVDLAVFHARSLRNPYHPPSYIHSHCFPKHSTFTFIIIDFFLSFIISFHTLLYV